MGAFCVQRPVLRISILGPWCSTNFEEFELRVRKISKKALCLERVRKGANPIDYQTAEVSRPVVEQSLSSANLD